MHTDLSSFEGVSAFVTGGAGFIGSHLVESLVRSGARVAAFDNLQAGSWENLAAVAGDVQLIEGDVRDRSALEAALSDSRPTYVFHLAANASVPGSVDDPWYDFETNCAGTVVLLESLRTSGSEARVVLASSAAVYGEPTEFPITEASALAPISPYGASKLSAEVESRIWNNVYGIPVVMARIFNTYGPRMPRFVVLDFLRKLQADPSRLEVLGTGSQLRDFNYVTDTASGLMILASHGVAGEAYNLASGHSHSVTELALQVIESVGLTGRTRIEYTGTSWVGDAQRWEVDVAKIHALGHHSEVTLEEGLSRVVEWFGFERS